MRWFRRPARLLDRLRVAMLKQLGESLSSRFINACNVVGSQTEITVANYTDRQVVLTLEVGDVVYRREELPPNESPDDDKYMAPLVSKNQESQDAERVLKRFGTNFATCKLPCGYAWYTIGACVSAYSEYSDDLVPKLPKYVCCLFVCLLACLRRFPDWL